LVVVVVVVVTVVVAVIIISVVSVAVACCCGSFCVVAAALVFVGCWNSADDPQTWLAVTPRAAGRGKTKKETTKNKKGRQPTKFVVN